MKRKKKKKIIKRKKYQSNINETPKKIKKPKVDYLQILKLLNPRPETIKLLEGNIGEEKLHDIGIGNNFLDITRKAQATKAKIDK